MPSPAYAVAVLCLAGLLQACPPAREPRSSAQLTAEEQAAAGHWQEAAQQYLQLAAAAEPSVAVRHRLRAAELLLKNGALESAEAILQELSLAEADTEPLAFRDLLLARIALQRDDVTAALHLVQPYSEAPFIELRAQAWEQSGEHGKASRELDALARTQTGPERARTHLRLWQLLKGMELDQLRRIPATGRGHFPGWVELAIIDQSILGKPEDWNTALIYWSRHFQQHPAMENVLPRLRERNRILYLQPKRLAVLLPSAGNFAPAARTIREGIVASWYQDGNERPSLLLYDTYQQDVLLLLQQAAEDGAEIALGPLEKEKVTALAALEKLPIPVLALNMAATTPGRARPRSAQERLQGLIQFGLSPENEAHQMARRAWFDGCTAALAVTPQGQWGQRIFDKWQQTWQELGGFLLEHAVFDPAASNDYADWIRALLNIDDSRARAARLQQVLRRQLETSIRYRSDADCLFLAASPEAARQFMPQLRYFGAGQLPVYANSRVYTGEVNLTADQDLDGLRFIDMPWILDPSLADVALENSQLMRDYGSGKYASIERLFAFGMDAYRLIDQLGALATGGLPHHRGMSGDLYLQEDDSIFPKLQWAQFHGGRARPLDASDP